MGLKHSYARALRCIGQILEDRDVAAFELKYQDDEFRVLCEADSPDLKLIHLSFSEQQISSLETLGRTKRRHPSKPPDFSSLSEILRAVGRFVDSKGGYLHRVCNVDFSDPAEDSITPQYALRQVVIEGIGPSQAT